MKKNIITAIVLNTIVGTTSAQNGQKQTQGNSSSWPVPAAYSGDTKKLHLDPTVVQKH